MKKEFGKWLMDISKYVTTAVLLSAIFVDIKEERDTFLIACIITILVCLGWGLFLVREPKKKKNNNNNNNRKGGKK